MGLVLLSSVSSAVFARPFILKNDSYFNVVYRLVGAEDTKTTLGYILQPGETVELDTNKSHSIRREGQGSDYIASYYNVPIKGLLLDAAKNDPNYPRHARASIPVCTIYSGVPYGWSFTLSWEQKENISF